eukprot:s2584_g2.t2
MTRSHRALGDRVGDSHPLFRRRYGRYGDPGDLKETWAMQFLCHCKKLKPDWDKLMDEINGGPGSLVADVDCTGEGQSLCQKYGVSGYPTLKYGDPGDLQETRVTRVELVKTCGPANLDLCSDEVKKKIEGYMAMSPDRLEGKIRNAIRIVEEEVPFMKKVSAHMKKAKSEL